MSTSDLSADTQAVLLLCGRFGDRGSGADPLTAGEYARLTKWLRERQMRPGSLLEDLSLAELVEARLEPGRVGALLKRGTAMALASEKWLRSGLWIVSRSDDVYPRRLKKKLGQDSPALLFGAGDTSLLDVGGLAIVGSRNATESELDFARDVAARCAREGIAVVSGGARGVDAAAMQGAGQEGGKVLGILADSLLRACVSRDNRIGIEEGRLALASPFHPEAGFNAGHAMQRNRYIYALADFGLVVQSDYEKGGTWAGAVENLKEGWVPLFVREDADSKGIAGLIKRGAQVYGPGAGSLVDALAGEITEPPKEEELFTASQANLAPATYAEETTAAPQFLEGLARRRVALDGGSAFTPIGLWIGQGSLALEVVAVEPERRPTAADMRTAWKKRLAGRAVPLLLVSVTREVAFVCGPSGDEPPVYENLARGQVERLCREALAMTDRQAVFRYLSQALPSLVTACPRATRP